MKKTLLFTLALLLAVAGRAQQNYDFSAVAPTGQTLYYNLVNGHAEVTCPGSLSWDTCTAPSGDLTIPDSVTHNGTTYAVTAIGEFAFPFCSDLTSVVIPTSVSSIGMFAFYNCSGLPSITIPSSVTYIGNGAFEDCTGLSAVYYTGGIGDWCGIQFVDRASNPLTYARRLYIGGAEVSDIEIPNTVTAIGNNTFTCCSSLTSVVIPNSVTSIGEWAFDNCSNLTSVTLPNSVTSIGAMAFRVCTNLSAVYYTGSIGDWCSILFDEGANPLLYAHYLYIGGAEVSNIEIPSTVTAIGNYAFEGCMSLTSVTIPATVSSIGDLAFLGCNNLDSVICLNPEPATLGVYAFSNNLATCHLIVPCGALEAYRQSAWGGYFSNITEDCGGTQGIEEAEPAEVLSEEYYDLLGRRLAQPPARGLYLLRTVTTSGTATRKIIKQ